MYGHIRQMALAEKAGIEKAGGTADLYQYVFGSLYTRLLCLLSSRC